MRRLSKPSYVVFALMWLFLVTLSGCGSGGSSSDATDSTDTSSPSSGSSGENSPDFSFVSSTPENRDSGVDLTTNVSITLSSDCDSATVSDTSFTLYRGDHQVSGSISSNGSNITFSPTEQLASGAIYTATLTTDVTATSGLPLETDQTWHFTTTSNAYQSKMPVGTNLPGLNYYTQALVYTDVMTTASELISFYNDTCQWDCPWDSGVIDEIPRDEDGWPTEIPYATSDGHQTKVRFLVNNHYPAGRYRILFDGSGTFSSNVEIEDGNYFVTLDGSGSNTVIAIDSSVSGNHIRNMRILPESYALGDSYPTFLPSYLDGLRPFHTLRFMDWISTNNSTQVHWSDRATPSYYSQGTSRGMAFEYAIELANELDTDVWVTVPHMASDDYIRQMAQLFRDTLEPDRKIYVEYSNELWNWMFLQSTWVLNNGQKSDGSDPVVNDYVATDLAAIETAGGNFPEKDAYMMARVFRIWTEEFASEASTRLVRVATGQQAWAGNTGRILNYLFNTDGIGCDAMAVTAYFNFTEENHIAWNSQDEVTPQEIIDAVLDQFDSGAGASTKATATYVNQYDIDYLVYEGGQHMQPWQQGVWDYNQAIWDAQIHPGMYQLYFKNFESLTDPEVDCRLFMAFSYMGVRESRWGSWGHLENLDQVGGDYLLIAPKYQALLDVNE